MSESHRGRHTERERERECMYVFLQVLGKHAKRGSCYQTDSDDQRARFDLVCRVVGTRRDCRVVLFPPKDGALSVSDNRVLGVDSHSEATRLGCQVSAIVC